MSVYQRIYIKTNAPREIEQLIIDTLGGEGRLESNDSGQYLRPISVAQCDQFSVKPSRSYYGSPLEVDADAETGWYWLSSIFDSWSVDACYVLWALYHSPLVELVAEDNEVSANEADSPAWIIHAEHELIIEGPPVGALE